VTSGDRGVQNWPWAQVQELLRLYGPDIGRLAKQGDALARNVRQRYQYAHDHPNDLAANRALRAALNDYMQRDLRESEQRELTSRFGHRIDDRQTH